MGVAALRGLGSRGTRWLAVAVLAAVVVALLPPVAGLASSPAGGLVSVIVQARPGALQAAAGQVEGVGGQVGRQLQVINGFSAGCRPGR